MVSLAILLTGCQGLGESAPTDAGSLRIEQEIRAEQIRQRETELSNRSAFQVEGGLGIWTDTETLSARLDWRQAAGSLDLNLAGPLGIGTLQLIDDGILVILTRGGKPVAQGKVADTVLQQGLGLDAPIPVSELGFWIRGLPGNASTVERDGSGKLSSLQFTDTQGTRWKANFRRYSTWDNIDVPTLITASGGRYSVRLRLKDWRYPAKTIVPARPESNNRLPIPGR